MIVVYFILACFALFFLMLTVSFVYSYRSLSFAKAFDRVEVNESKRDRLEDYNAAKDQLQRERERAREQVEKLKESIRKDGLDPEKPSF